MCVPWAGGIILSHPLARPFIFKPQILPRDWIEPRHRGGLTIIKSRIEDEEEEGEEDDP